MKLSELKEQILNNTLSDSFMVFKCIDNHFLADQYINEICEQRGAVINKINSIFEPNKSALALVLDFKADLNVLKVDEFSEFCEDYSELSNIIVVCDKIDKKIAPLLTDYVIEFPKLLDWQILDYMKVLCSGLSTEDYQWLYTVSNGNIYKIINELDKIRLFKEQDRPKVIDYLRADKNTDLFVFEIFNLVDAVVKKDFQVILNYLKHSEFIQFDPIGFINLLLSKYKNIAYVKSGRTAQELGLSPQQFYAISRNYTCTRNEVLKAIKFLSGLDLRLKSNLLDADSKQIIEYTIVNLVC